MRQEERDRARALVADKAVTEVHFGGVSAERWGPEGEAVWYVVDRRYKTAAGLTACRTSMRMDAVTAVVWARRISKVDAFGRDAAWSVLWQTPANKLVVEDQPSETPVRVGPILLQYGHPLLGQGGCKRQKLGLLARTVC